MVHVLAALCAFLHFTSSSMTGPAGMCPRYAETVHLIENGRLLEHGSPGSVNSSCGHVHYTHRAPWLRAAVLGANDGLVTVGALMTGIGAADVGQHQLLLSAVAALVAGVSLDPPSTRAMALCSTLLNSESFVREQLSC